MTTVARLRALVTVADTGSVRQAARRLTVTESAVSSALSALAVTHGRQPGATALLIEHLLAREGWRRPRGPKEPPRKGLTYHSAISLNT